MTSRRDFLTKASKLAVAASVPALTVPNSFAAVAKDARQSRSAQQQDAASWSHQARVSLDGRWQFKRDPEATGKANGWHERDLPAEGWREIVVPHTWQVAQDSAEYFGTAWYRHTFEAPTEWSDRTIRIEFEGVFHSATVWVNGQEAGQHLRKGYTAFVFDITSLLRMGGQNSIAVLVNSMFDNAMLPRGRSSDWTHDGGIYRPVSLIVTPKVYVERVDIDATPNLEANTAEVEIAVLLRNSGRQQWQGHVSYRAAEESSGLTALENAKAVELELKAGETKIVRLPKATMREPKLWHFDHPNLYTLITTISSKDGSQHQLETVFGVRSIEVKDAAFYLNGERVRLMGVERMAGSNPNFGMAEPATWIDHDHDHMKVLNCVFTRVHWPQDKRVLDYCDRHGILIQTEVPTWGPDTFKDMQGEPAAEIMENGLEQLREMVNRDRNHPRLFSWGLCNEINGQHDAAYKFAGHMCNEAKKLDPRRLCSYASNSLQSKPGADVSRLMDFIEWNEYYETWYPGTPNDLRRNLAEIHQAFPNKPIVISEYGYCACTVDRPEGDARRIEILRDHTRVCRETDYVGGLIFFCYNDYRTHIGDKGTGVMKQRVHGVVDLFGRRKPSYEVLRQESSPIELLSVKGHPADFYVSLRTRQSAPAYVLKGYTLRAILYGYGDIPLERREMPLPVLEPGQETSIPVQFREPGAVRVEFDVMRSTGFSAYTRAWKP